MDVIISGKTGHMSNSLDSSGFFAGVLRVLLGRKMVTETLVEIQVSH